MVCMYILHSVGNYDSSLHQVTTLPSLPEGDDQQQQSYLENDDVSDKEVVPKNNTFDDNVEANTLQEPENEVQEESQRGTVNSKECVVPHSNPLSIITGT